MVFPYLCVNTQYYENFSVETNYFFFPLALLYILMEILLIWRTVVLIINVPKVIKNVVLMILYACLHINFIRSIFSFLSGSLICISKLVYMIICEYFHIFKECMPIILSYKIITIMRTLGIRYKFDKYFHIVMFVLFIILFGIYTFFLLRHESFLVPDLLYTSISKTIVLVITFNYPMIFFLKQMIKNLNFLKSISLIGDWYFLYIAMNAYFLQRIFFLIFCLAGYYSDTQEANNSDMFYAVTMCMYYIITEAIPAWTVFAVLNANIYKEINENLNRTNCNTIDTKDERIINESFNND